MEYFQVSEDQLPIAVIHVTQTEPDQRFVMTKDDLPLTKASMLNFWTEVREGKREALPADAEEEM